MTKEKKEKKPVKGFRRFLRGFFRVLGVLLLLLMIAVGALLLIPAFEKFNAKADPSMADWMSALPDEKKLSEIRIPGIHDAATEYVELAFITRCQEKSIKELLEDGFRYVDVRLMAEASQEAGGSSRLRFMHGPTKCKTGFWPWEANLYLDDVLNDCYEFLEAHPGETILFVVKQESGNESVSKFQAVLNQYLEGKKDKWYLSEDTLPTLGEARGKLVLFRRYADEAGLGDEAGLPLIWADQGNKGQTELNYAVEQGGSFKLAVQDRYKYGNNDKWAAFTAAPSEQADVTVSFLSTAGNRAVGHPFAHAKALNKKLLALPKEKIPEGWIILDFGNAELAKHIVEAN